MNTFTTNGMNTTLPASEEVVSNKSSRDMRKRLDKTKEAVRLALQADKRYHKKKYKSLIAKRAELKLSDPSTSTQSRVERLNKRIKYFEPENSFKTVSTLVQLNELKSDAHKLKKRANWNNESFMALCHRVPAAELCNTQTTEEEATEEEGEAFWKRLYGAEKKEMRVQMYLGEQAEFKALYGDKKRKKPPSRPEDD